MPCTSNSALAENTPMTYEVENFVHACRETSAGVKAWVLMSITPRGSRCDRPHTAG